jgi:hypothetical protein
MKKGFAAALLVLALISCASGAGAIGVGVGAFGGANFPVLMDNAAPGPVYGLRVPVKLIPMFTVEPFWSTSALGDASQDFGALGSETRDGGTYSTFGVNALLTAGGAGFKMFPYAGIGSGKYQQTGVTDLTNTAVDFGLGFNFGLLPNTSLDLRGEFDALITGDTSRKFANVTAGLTYRLPLP